jgi:hypothetical protein
MPRATYTMAEEKKKARLEAQRLRRERKKLAEHKNVHDEPPPSPTKSRKRQRQEVPSLDNNELASLPRKNESNLEAARLRLERRKRELETASARREHVTSLHGSPPLSPPPQVLQIRKDQQDSVRLRKKYHRDLQATVEKILPA